MFKRCIDETKLASHADVVTVRLMRIMRNALLVTMASLGVVCCWCELASAEVPAVRQVNTGVTPFVQVEEFVPRAGQVNAEFYAFLIDAPRSKLTTVSLQYVDAEGYDPGAVSVSQRYAAGVTVVVAETAVGEPELHAHLVLEPDKTYHYRIVAENADGSFETPDETVQTYPPVLGALPDGRAYEQVSPVDKNNLDALGNGKGMTMQASPSGSRFAFFSFEPFPVAVGSSRFSTEYLSSRSSSPVAWSTQGVQPLTEPFAKYDEAVGFTEDLERIVLVSGPLLGSDPRLGSVGVTNAYVRNNATGEYKILAHDVGSNSVLFADATPDDSRILFETRQPLLPAVGGGSNLYEWDEDKPESERLSLAGVLPASECAALSEPPGCAPAAGSGAGPGNNERQDDQDYLQDTISTDGSKVFFTAHPSGRVYEREPEAQPEPVTVSVSPGAAIFLAATPSGRYVFYSEGKELYRFDSENETSEALTSGAEDILGSLGISEDGEYAYFVANGVLAADENANGEHAITGALNLYEWHEDPATHTDQTMFIARLSSRSEHSEADESDWFASDTGGERTSRVTPDGKRLLFMSHSSLTGYDNKRCPRTNVIRTERPCAEYFLYTADGSLSPVNPVCVSCNPTGVAATAPVYLTLGENEAALLGTEWSAHLTRNLSVGGDRVFFETAESLVPGDTNGVSDVYEWERGGVGSCPSGQDHCLYLVSTGTAHAKSFFGDADAEGNNVFFFTRQPLVGQDNDLNFDVYDARVGGGIPAQNPPVDRCEGEGCKSPASPVPVFAEPASVTLTGSGNLVPQPPPPSQVATKCPVSRKLSHGKCVVVKCVKGRRLSRGKCVKVNNKKKVRARRGKAAKPHQKRGRR